MTTLTADQVISDQAVAVDPHPWWMKTKETAGRVTDAISNFWQTVKVKTNRFFNRHEILATLVAGTALVMYWTTVFVAVTVIATYMLIFAFSWTEKIFGF